MPASLAAAQMVVPSGTVSCDAVDRQLTVLVVAGA